MNVQGSTQQYYNTRTHGHLEQGQHVRNGTAKQKQMRHSQPQEIGSSVDKLPQNYKRGQLNAQGVKALQKYADQAHTSLKTLVRKLLEQQNAGIKFKDSDSGHVGDDVDVVTLPVSETSGDEWGAKETAARIVNFAKALAGDDKSKLAELKDAVIQGFAEAEKILGGLPDVSTETYDEVMRLFDEWEQSE